MYGESGVGLVEEERTATMRVTLEQNEKLAQLNLDLTVLNCHGEEGGGAVLTYWCLK